ncbi:MAG: ThuA domain-containing protein [Opitutaceae bacterium]|jgi:type 1 glutamine amidotransferase|nr:ThuA domain-containing protein [Opitutaceae bacterium]
MKKALFLAGGWPGHQPEKIVQLLAGELNRHEISSDIETSLDVLADEAALRRYDLISPCWTMGQLTKEQAGGLQAAVRAGIGLAGVHGGMGDAFRGNLDYEWMVGGLFVGHPHVGEYTVRVRDIASPITAGLPASFRYRSEQYYMLVDPAVQVLADTDYVHDGRMCTMPVAWVKRWGRGRVFYCALGHAPEEFSAFPDALALTIRGLLWAGGAL